MIILAGVGNELEFLRESLTCFDFDLLLVIHENSISMNSRHIKWKLYLNLKSKIFMRVLMCGEFVGKPSASFPPCNTTLNVRSTSKTSLFQLLPKAIIIHIRFLVFETGSLWNIQNLGADLGNKIFIQQKTDLSLFKGRFSVTNQHISFCRAQKVHPNFG